MFRLLLKLLTARALSRLSEDLEWQLEESRRAFQRTGTGIVMFQISVPFFVAGFGFWLATLFMSLAEIDRYLWPAFWTGAVSLALALILALRAVSLFRNR